VDRQKQTGGSVEELSHCKVQPASCGARDNARTALALKAIRRDGFFYVLPCRGSPKTNWWISRRTKPLQSSTGIMRRARQCAHRARPKSHPQGWLFLRAPVPWIAKNKLVDQSKN
jgi:hypothetical protein